MNYPDQEFAGTLSWLNDEEIEKIFSSGYWNNEEIEKEKDWYILDGNTQKMIDYLQKKTTYFRGYEEAIEFSKKMGAKIEGTGIDLAAGVCWTTALLSRIDGVKKIYAVDIAKHRLLKIAPAVFDLFKANKGKIVRVIGNIYDIKLPDRSLDFCIMSQAFHHVDKVDKFLSEVYRVLKDRGFIILIGETPVPARDVVMKYIRNAVKIVLAPLIRFKTRPIYKLFPNFRDLYQPDNEAGDHYYRIGDYHKIFESSNFSLFKNRQNRFATFIAIKN